MEKLINVAYSKDEIVNQLKQMGLKENMTVEVHSAFSKTDFVIGGPRVFNDALLETVGENGNIVMAAQDYNNSEPLLWENPPMDMALADKYRENMVGYDIYQSGLHLMGILVDDLRSRKNAYLSYHPNCGFVCVGKDSKYLMSNQPLSFPFSMQSPLGKMYKLDNSYTLLVGVDYNNCTSWHLAEYISQVRPIVLQGGCIKKGGKNVWKKYLDYQIDSEIFLEIGNAYQKTGSVKVGKVAGAVCKFFKMSDAIDFATDYLTRKLG